jgi:hypothetical protein
VQKNDAQQYLKAMKSVPAFSSILDKLDDRTIEEMEREIVQAINNSGGYIDSRFEFSLYITKKVG